MYIGKKKVEWSWGGFVNVWVILVCVVCREIIMNEYGQMNRWMMEMNKKKADKGSDIVTIDEFYG